MFKVQKVKGEQMNITITHLLTVIGKTNSKLEEKLYTRKEVKEILLNVAKECEVTDGH